MPAERQLRTAITLFGSQMSMT
ncbi:MAG: hypothetical protein JWO77_457, partial [Ilumatobacteraceae bacterium]|nr:hypothetical protein [Ilumatobacteraceae bacterium]